MDSATEPASNPAFRLLVLGDGSIRTIPLVGNRWVIGRAPDCSISLRDPTASRRHLLLEREGTTFRFQDLGGSNPLLLDGKPTGQGVLKCGQMLLVGLTRLTIEQRVRPVQVVPEAGTTVILSREIIDEDLPATTADAAAAAALTILERIEWTFADLGGLEDVAEPLLGLALNLTRRNRGLIVRFRSPNGIETLASVHGAGGGDSLQLPERVLAEARHLGRPGMLRTEEAGVGKERLVIPLGGDGDALMVLEEAAANAPRGQDLLRLGGSLGRVIWHRLLEASERLRLREEIERLRFHGTSTHNALLASSRLQALRQQLRERANTDTPVLLVGELGTERESLARYLHSEGNRAKAPFVVVNLATVPAERREGEIFGDASSSTHALARATGGTLFLDGVDHLAAPLQERLAAVLAAGLAPARTGSQALPQARLVLASTTPPEGSAAWSTALLERAGRDPLQIPPLRSDPRDVLSLAELILAELGTNREGRPRLLSERSKRLLESYSWPGNVQELRNVLESAAARAGLQDIAPRHLPDHIAEPAGHLPGGTIPTLEEIEKRHIREVLLHFGGNRARAAKALGIASSTLYEKVRRHGLD